MLPATDCLSIVTVPLWVAFLLGASLTVLVLIAVWGWLVIKD